MQRLEPRELVAAAAAAVVPLLWLGLVATGNAPKLLDDDRGAAFVLSITGEDFWGGGAGVGLALLLHTSGMSLLGAAQAAFALALWAAGYGAWAWAKQGAGALGAAAFVVLVQLGPWCLEPLGFGGLGTTQITALAAGPVLLGLAYPRLSFLAALWSPAAGAVVALGGLLRKRWSALVGLLGVLPLLLTPPSSPLATATVPTYAGEAGAWFPLPPLESAKWAQIAGLFDGRWVHPLAAAVSGAPVGSRPTQALPLAVEAAVVPKGPPAVAPTLWVVAQLPEGAVRDVVRARGVESFGFPLVIAVVAALWSVRRARVPLGVGAVAVSVALVGLHGRPAGAVTGAELLVVAESVAGEAVVWFPPPEAPFFAGRVSEVRWGAAEAVAGVTRAPPDTVNLAAFAAATGYGLDTLAAERLSATAPDAPLATPGAVVVVDVGALPPWMWSTLRGRIVAAGGEVEDVAGWAVVRF